MDKPLYSSAFTQGIFSRGNQPKDVVAAGGELLLKVLAPMILRNQVLAVVGSVPELGAWKVEKALLLDDSNFPEWSIAIDLTAVKGAFEYKFLILDKKTHGVVAWENCNN